MHETDERQSFFEPPVFTQAISSRNAPSCLSAMKKPTEDTLAGFSDGTSVNTRPRKVGMKSLNGSRCSSHSPRFGVKAH